MAEQTIICPHCRAKKSMYSHYSADLSSASAHFLFVCENCNLPVVLWAVADKPKLDFRRVADVDRAGQSFEQCGWRVVDSWPKPQFRKGTVPEGVPEDLAPLLEHSHEAAARGGYDLAIMGYQRALKMAQSSVSPEFRGNSHAWVLSLIEAGHVTAGMKSWANRVKLRSSSIEAASALQAEEFAAFLDVILEQVFGTRSRIAHYRCVAAD